MPDPQAVQVRYAPRSVCFGCGPANPGGLHLRSFESLERPGELVAEWQATTEQEAFPGVLNGGICGTLLDCHANWAAALHLMRRHGAEQPPATVTAEYEVRLQRPTPTDGPLQLRSWVTFADGERAIAEAEISAGGRVSAQFRGTFVAVREGHPAFHRWD
jgi:acyl-coenzyme A thioesterase PaaI-like protein